ncbi:MAG: hypothetical protein ACK6A7_17105 [Planctomycetota bacterium]|jgi:hypothetical protein
MSDTIETRLARVERELAILRSKSPRDKSNWLVEITGTFKDDPYFEEIVRLGKEMRDAEQPECEQAKMYPLDSDHLSILQRQQGPEFETLAKRCFSGKAEDFFVAIVSFHEQFNGWTKYIAQAKDSLSLVRG